MTDNGETPHGYSPEIVRPIFNTYLGLLVVSTTVFGVLFWKRRNIQPIAARVPELTVIANVVFVVLTASVCMNLTFLHDYPCWAVHLIGSGLAFAIISVYLVRCLVLIYNFEYTIALYGEFLELESDLARSSTLDQISRVSTTSKSKPGLDEVVASRQETLSNNLRHYLVRQRSRGMTQWYLKNRRLMSARTLSAVAVIAWSICMLPPFVAFLSSPPKPKDSRGFCNYSTGTFAISSMAVAVSIFFMGLSWHMREITDAYWIKSELRITALYTLVSVVVWGFILTFTDITDKAPYHSAITLSEMLVAHVVSMIIPVIRSYHLPQITPLHNLPEQLNSLSGICQHRKGRDAFAMHLKDRFSMELLVFHEKVREYKRTVESISLYGGEEEYKQDVEKAAKSIYFDFIAPGSPHEVNIPHHVRAPLDDLFGQDYETLRTRQRRHTRLLLIGPRPTTKPEQNELEMVSLSPGLSPSNTELLLPGSDELDTSREHSRSVDLKTPPVPMKFDTYTFDAADRSIMTLLEYQFRMFKTTARYSEMIDALKKRMSPDGLIEPSRAV